MSRICLVTGAPLCRNPRVVKEAYALAEAGHRVVIVRPVLTDVWLAQDDDLMSSFSGEIETSADLRGTSLAAIRYRAERRISAELVSRMGMQLAGATAYGIRRALEIARKVSAAMTIGHQETGLFVCEELQRSNQTIGLDFEDWYSRDLLPSARKSRPVDALKSAEKRVAQKAAQTTATSLAMGKAISYVYKAPLPISVYNAFPSSDRSLIKSDYRIESQKVRLIWFSQTIGAGRGLEPLFEALSKIGREFQLTLIGSETPGYLEGLSRRFPLSHGELVTKPPVPPGSLLGELANHDIGMALEVPHCASRDLTITNKIFHYLQAGLAIVASETRGQREAARRARGAIEIITGNDGEALRSALRTLMNDRQKLEAMKAASWRAGSGLMSWERQQHRLVESVERGLHRCAIC